MLYHVVWCCLRMIDDDCGWELTSRCSLSAPFGLIHRAIFVSCRPWPTIYGLPIPQSTRGPMMEMDLRIPTATTNGHSEPEEAVRGTWRRSPANRLRGSIAQKGCRSSSPFVKHFRCLWNTVCNINGQGLPRHIECKMSSTTASQEYFQKLADKVKRLRRATECSASFFASCIFCNIFLNYNSLIFTEGSEMVFCLISC